MADMEVDAIIGAILAEDLETLSTLVAQTPAAVSKADEFDCTPLEVALVRGNSEMAHVLISANADVNASLSEGSGSLLTLAADNGDLGTTSKLLAAGAEPNFVDKEGNNVLHCLAEAMLHFDEDEEGDSAVPADAVAEFIEMFTKAGGNMEATNDGKRTPLHSASLAGNDAVAMALVQAGSSVSAVDNKGDTPLHLASYAAAAAVRTILLEAGADENVENMDGKTPKAMHMRQAAAEPSIELDGYELISVAEEGNPDQHPDLASRCSLKVGSVIQLGFLTQTPDSDEGEGLEDEEEEDDEEDPEEIPVMIAVVRDEENPAGEFDAAYMGVVIQPSEKSEIVFPGKAVFFKPDHVLQIESE